MRGKSNLRRSIPFRHLSPKGCSDFPGHAVRWQIAYLKGYCLIRKEAGPVVTALDREFRGCK